MDHLLSSHDLTNKSVLLRLDLDVPLKDGVVADNSRLRASLPTLKKCLSQARKTLIIGHLGRPKGEELEFSLKPVLEELKRLLNRNISFITSLEKVDEWGSDATPLGLLENLRFWPGEDKNDSSFAKSLAKFGDIFINDAFASSHRESASGIGIPKLLPSLLGSQFEAELKGLYPITEHPRHPIIAIIGGSKADKIEIVDNLLTHVDKVLVGGSIVSELKPNPKIVAATLTEDGLDIDAASIDIFRSHIKSASTLIWNGPMGKYEDSLHGFHGTSQLAEAISTAKGYKIAGGGDTLAVIDKLNIFNKFDHISLGGGAMLYYIIYHTLPSLEAILNSQKIT